LTAGGSDRIEAVHADLGAWSLSCPGAADLLFTENETNVARLTGGPNRTPWGKDGIDRWGGHGETDAVNPSRTGTKAAAVYPLMVPGGGASVIRLRLAAADRLEASDAEPDAATIDQLVALRRREADTFYAGVIPSTLAPDEAAVMRQAAAGMLWSKQ